MQEHGEFQVKAEGQVIVSYLTGAWNVETANKYFESVRQHARSIYDKSWARLVDLSQWEGSGDDVAKVLVSLQQWAVKHKGKHVAYVKPHTLSKYMMEKYKLQDVINYHVFEEHEAALAYLDLCIQQENI